MDYQCKVLKCSNFSSFWNHLFLIYRLNSKCKITDIKKLFYIIIWFPHLSPDLGAAEEPGWSDPWSTFGPWGQLGADQRCWVSSQQSWYPNLHTSSHHVNQHHGHGGNRCWHHQGWGIFLMLLNHHHHHHHYSQYHHHHHSSSWEQRWWGRQIILQRNWAGLQHWCWWTSGRSCRFVRSGECCIYLHREEAWAGVLRVLMGTKIPKGVGGGALAVHAAYLTLLCRHQNDSVLMYAVTAPFCCIASTMVP